MNFRTAWKGEKIMNQNLKKYGVKISVEFVQREESPATPVNAPVVLKLKDYTFTRFRRS